MESQCQSMVAEIGSQEQRIQSEKVIFKDRARKLKAEDDQISERKKCVHCMRIRCAYE